MADRARGSGLHRLGRRALNRALLARQGLLERTGLAGWGEEGVADVLRHLVGMQAQLPGDPYIGLWSRLGDFDPMALSDLIAARRAVRLPLMRSTIHLVTADDACLLRPLFQTVIERTTRSLERRALEGVDMAALAGAARVIVDESPRTPAELDRRLAERWPGRERGALANAARTHLPLVQVPPRGLWRGVGHPTLASLEAWLGLPLEEPPDLARVVFRYLRAYGPASAADLRAWGGLAVPRGLLDGLRPQLRVYRDQDGRELLDVDDGLLPGADVPAPVRFLPVYDNLVLGHRDRSRIVPEDVASALPLTAENVGSVLVDGFVGARWRLKREPRRVRLLVELLRDTPRSALADVEAEGTSLLAFLIDDALETTVEVAQGRPV